MHIVSAFLYTGLRCLVINYKAFYNENIMGWGWEGGKRKANDANNLFNIIVVHKYVPVPFKTRRRWGRGGRGQELKITSMSDCNVSGGEGREGDNKAKQHLCRIVFCIFLLFFVSRTNRRRAKRGTKMILKR